MISRTETLIVFCPNWVGDVVMATPFFQCLRETYPDTRIIGVIRRYVRGVVEDGPWFDQVISCNDKTFKDFCKLVKILREIKPDLAVLLPNTFRCAVIARLGGSKKIIGYKRNFRSIMLSDGPKPVRGKDNKYLPVPMVEYYMNLCRWLDIKAPENTKPTLFISEFLQKEGEKLLEKYGIGFDDTVVGINPGAKFGSSKCWPPQYFAKLAELVEKGFGCKILLFAGPGEGKIASSITEKSKAAIINTFPDRVDLAHLKYLVKRCALLITNDTGPRHYAVSFGVPVLVIMGPTDPRYTNSNLKKTLVLRKNLDCSPCHLTKCPLDHRCMKEITPESVFEGAKELWERFV